MSFKRSIKVGVTWSSASQLGRQVLQILTMVILARLLDPSDFGLVSMAMVVVGMAALFKDFGTLAAIIQRKSVSAEFLSSIYWTNLLAGSILTFILYICSSPIASFYHEPRLEAILQSLSLSFVISSFGGVHQALLERNLNFRVLATIELTATGLGAAIGLFLGWSHYGVWSLVCQYMTIVTVTTILLIYISKWHPDKYFRLDELKSIGSFSLNLIGFNFVNFLIRNFDNFLIGKFWGAQNLGYYTVAYQIMLFPLQNISAVVNRVLFPIYSQMQDDDSSFRIIYLKISAAITLITVPLMVGLFVTAKPFVLTVLGKEWLPVSILLMIFAPIGLIHSIGTMVGAIYQAKGRTDWMFRWILCATVVIILSFFIGIRWGCVGVAWGYLLATLFLAYPSLSIPFRLIHLKVSELMRLIQPALYSGLVMFLCLISLRTILPEGLSNIEELGILLLSGFIVYFLMIWQFHRKFAVELLEMINLKT